MRKLLNSILALTLISALALTAASCGGSDGGGGSGKLEEIKKAGKLVVYTDPNFAPFEYIGDDETIVGVDIALAEEIAAELGVTLEVNSAKFDSILMALKGGKGDIAISGFTITEERRESVDFSDPYIDSVQYLILPEDSGISALE
ncbi:MAG: transporter substrate-binding domain-containing protein, partial [Oscillospiraceae bacterium]|nr:transporter substrate-binding domain-containing protein [Oscillospiraceae bacterium]